MDALSTGHLARCEIVGAVLDRIFDRTAGYEPRVLACFKLEPEEWAEFALRVLDALEDVREAVDLTAEASWLDGLRGRILVRLAPAPPLPQATLADRVKASESATCKAVAALARKGLIARERDRVDRRVVRLRLTDKGRVELDDWRRRRVILLGRWLKDLNPRDLDLLVDVTRVTEHVTTRIVSFPLRPLA